MWTNVIGVYMWGYACTSVFGIHTGVGVYGCDDTRLLILRSTLKQNDHAIGYDDNTHITVSECM